MNTLNFRFFDGDPTNSNGGDYASPYYTNAQGMLGITLHEIGHLTAEGAETDRLAKYYHYKEFGNYNSYQRGDYFASVESFANDFAIASSEILNLSISEVTGLWDIGHIPPAQIYYDHMGY